jgi:hypothetical protein
MWTFFDLELNTVKGISATSALGIQVPVLASKIVFVYVIFCDTFSGMVPMARFMAGSRRAVITQVLVVSVGTVAISALMPRTPE